MSSLISEFPQNRRLADESPIPERLRRLAASGPGLTRQFTALYINNDEQAKQVA